MTTVVPILSLSWREIIRFFRQRSRVIGALLSPLLIWAVIGAGVGMRYQSPWAPAGRGYLEYFYPGIILMILLFTSIFSTISIIEDRKEGFLQAVLVSPVSRVTIVLGKVFGTVGISVFQGLATLLILPFIGVPLHFVQVLVLTVVFILVSIGLTALGFAMAWKFDSVQGFHAIMNVLLFPLWMLSGAIFPTESVPSWMAFLIAINPLTYGLALLRRSIYPGEFSQVDLPGSGFSIVVLCVFAAAMLGWSIWSVSKKGTGKRS